MLARANKLLAASCRGLSGVFFSPHLLRGCLLLVHLEGALCFLEAGEGQGRVGEGDSRARPLASGWR